MSPDNSTGGKIVLRLDTRYECYRHLAIYVIANGITILAWWMRGGGTPWFLIPVIAWGIAVIAHFGQYYNAGKRVFYPETIPAMLATILTFSRLFPVSAIAEIFGYILGIGVFYGLLLVWLLITGFIRRMLEGGELFLRFGRYTNDHYRISIKFPLIWKDSTGDFPEPGLVVHATDGQGTSIRVYATPIPDGSECTVEDLEKRSREYVEGLHGHPESMKRIALAGVKAVETTWVLSPVKTRMTALCRNHLAYRIVCSSPVISADLYEPVFRESVHSVRFP